MNGAWASELVTSAADGVKTQQLENLLDRDLSTHGYKVYTRHNVTSKKRNTEKRNPYFGMENKVELIG